jgi:hypothetical protein
MNTNNNYSEKKQKIKNILSIPGITQQQYQRALQLLRKIEQDELKYNASAVHHQQQRRQHQTTQTTPTSFNNVNHSASIVQHHTDLTGSDFDAEEERRRKEFEQQERIRRQKFLEEQQRRRNEYQQKLSALETNNINSLDIMGLSPNYNENELKTAYKRLAIQYHPDRPGGNKDKFQLVTKCYMSLMEKLNSMKTEAHGYSDLKGGFSKYINNNCGTEDRMREQMQSMFVSKKSSGGSDRVDNKFLDPKSQSFNSTLFNKLYEENKLWDPNDDGYDDWFRNGPDTEEDKPELFGDKFNINIFNTTFNNHKSKNQDSNAIVKYNEPTELVSAMTSFTEIDNTKPVEDFSKPIDSPGSLQYTDLKKAYTGGCKFINPEDIDPRKEYKSIEELQKDRSNINYNMTPQERAIYEAKKLAQEEEEYRRRERLRQLDTIQSEHFKQTHQAMLGYSGNPE